MAVAPKASFKLIVSLDGVNTPLYSGTLFALKSALDGVDTAVASLLADADGSPSILVVQLTSAPVAPDPPPDPVPDPTPEPAPLVLTTQSGDILSAQDLSELVWP